MKHLLKAYLILALFATTSFASSMGAGAMYTAQSSGVMPSVSANTVTGNTTYYNQARGFTLNGVPDLLSGTSITAQTLYATGAGVSTFNDDILVNATITANTVKVNDMVTANTVTANAVTASSVFFPGFNYIAMPYGMYSDSRTLTVTSNTAAYQVSFNTAETSSRVSHNTVGNTSSRFYIQERGTYMITVSAICNTGVANKKLELWERVNNVNVPRSNTIVALNNTNIETTLAVSFINNFLPNDYFELWYCGSDTSCTFKATAAQTSPVRPACPSIIMTVNKIADYPQGG